MNDPENISRFILLRAQGCSFDQIARELNISKPTLIKWSRQRQFAIANLRATETEALAQRLFGERQQRWERLANHLKKLEDEIDKRELGEIPVSRLYRLAASLRAEIQRQTGHIQFTENSKDIPDDEKFICKHEWEA